MGVAESVQSLIENTAKVDQFVHGGASDIVQTRGGNLVTLSNAQAQINAKLYALTAYNPRGAWATATPYALKDLVTESSVVYVVTAAHISGTFLTDLAAGYLAIWQGSDSLLSEVYSTIKGRRYVSNVASITDHGATSGDDYDAMNLAAVVAACGSDLSIVVLPRGSYTISTDLSVPDNVILKFDPGAVIVGAIGDETLTVNGGIDAGRHQIFDNLTVVNAGTRTPIVIPEWWGETHETECSGAIMAAFDFAFKNTTSLNPRQSRLLLAGNQYLISQTLDFSGAYDIDIECIGEIVQADGANLDMMVYFFAGRFSNLRLKLDGNQDNNTSTTIGAQFKDCWTSGELHVYGEDISGAVVDGYGSTENWDIYVKAYDCGDALALRDYMPDGSDDGSSPHEIRAHVSAILCQRGVYCSSGGIRFIDLHASQTPVMLQMDASSDGASGGGLTYLRGMSEASVSTGGIVVNDGELVFEDFYLRHHKGILGEDSWAVRINGGTAYGRLMLATDVDTACNGVQIHSTGYRYSRPFDIAFDGCGGIGVEIGSDTESVSYQDISVSIVSCVNENIKFRNGQYNVIRAKRLATPSYGVSNPISITDEGAYGCNDSHIFLAHNQHTHYIEKAAGAQRFTVVYEGYFSGAKIAEIPNVFAGMRIEQYAGQSNRLKALYATTDGAWAYENEHDAAILNGNTSVTVTHGLPGTPLLVFLCGTHSEVSSAYVTNRTSTTFDIVVPAAVTGDRTVYWMAATQK